MAGQNVLLTKEEVVALEEKRKNCVCLHKEDGSGCHCYIKNCKTCYTPVVEGEHCATACAGK